MGIAKRFIAIFYPAAEFNKLAITVDIDGEKFFANARECAKEGYLEVWKKQSTKDEQNVDNEPEETKMINVKKGEKLNIKSFEIKESETNPPTRYNSGSIILAMENAGKLIEDEELREQIKGAGIGTSATRGGILKNLKR